MAAERAALRSAPPGGHQDQVRALFDSKAAGWPGKYAPAGRLAGRLARLDAAVRARVGAGDPLDLGCGSGDLARRLAADGLRAAPARGRRGPRAPLRLLTFTQPGTFPGQQGDASDNRDR